jgi:methylaspartate mutase epsilon subunit
MNICGDRDICNRKLSEEEFKKIRKKVMTLWPTGKKAINLESNIEYGKKIASYKNVALKLKKAKEENKTLIMPRGGVALVDEHIELLKCLQDEGGADLLPATIDSYTRNARYKEAQEALENNIKVKGHSLLNGFPAVNHGVSGCRRITEAINVPIIARTCAPYPTLLAEILTAGGFTSTEGGGITCLIPYTKNDSLEESIKEWQYVARLLAYYEENGIPTHRESYAPMTGTLVPPCIQVAIAVIECILDVEQGVKNFTLGYGQGGNLLQDIAAVKVMGKLGEEYIKRLGYVNVNLTTVFHTYMGAFPQDEAKAWSIICTSAMVAALSNATYIITKSIQEAYGIPTKESNAAGVRAVKHVLSMFKNQRIYNSSDEKLQKEIEVITEGAKAIIERVIELGEGDIAKGVISGFKAGVLDVPFSPSIHNLGKVMTCKDSDGAIRFADCGNLPLSRTLREFHEKKLHTRKTKEKKTITQIIIEDIYALVGQQKMKNNKERFL